MKKEQKRRSAYTPLVWRIIVLALALWLGCMGVMTWVVAQDMYNQLYREFQDYVDHVYFASYLEYTSDTPGYVEKSLLPALEEPIYRLNVENWIPFVLPQRIRSDSWLYDSENFELIYGFECDVRYYDKNGEMILGNGNYLGFHYVSDEMWSESSYNDYDDYPYNFNYTYIDLDTLPDGGEVFYDLSPEPGGPYYGSYDNYWWDHCPMLRLTGYFEESRFCPVVIDRVLDDFYIHNIGGQSAPVSYMEEDKDTGLEWVTIFDHSGETEQELVTIYCWPDLYDDLFRSKPREHSAGKDESGSSLKELLDTIQASGAKYNTVGFNDLLPDSLVETVFAEELSYSYYPYPYDMDNFVEEDYFARSCVLAVRFHPLQYAMIRLHRVYITTFLAGALLIWLLLWRIKREVILPLRKANRLAAGNLEDNDDDSRRQEFYELEAHIARLLKADHANKTEIQRLRTALEYAKNAEENRRMLVSNITHELKTPLAVIHSYAEGLQAGIAGEDQDRYLNVIQEEAEKMDAMVLEMLDLSRLEAGKVRLHTETFSLLALTQSIVETLEPMAQAKNLEIRFDFAQDCLLTADKSRMDQVITNLMSNAIRYTAPGGSIRIILYHNNGNAYFQVENPCQPLSQEALDNVFTSFYQADTSHKTKGTGLGLPIVKSIVELHRGSCTVKNTSDGVRFGFSIPLS